LLKLNELAFAAISVCYFKFNHEKYEELYEKYFSSQKFHISHFDMAKPINTLIRILHFLSSSSSPPLVYSSVLLFVIVIVIVVWIREKRREKREKKRGEAFSLSGRQ
jgi:L-asparagine transporter-like permease